MIRLLLVILLVVQSIVLSAQDNCGKGFEAIGEGSYKQAVKLLNKCIKQEATATNYYNRARAFTELGKQGKAEKDLKKALKADQTFLPAYYSMAEIRLSERDVDAAAEVMTTAITFNPEDAYAHNFRGWIYLSSGNNNRAFRDFNRAVELDSTFASAYNNRGTARYYMQDVLEVSANDLRQAKNDFLTALAIDPKLTGVHRNLGYVSIYLKEYEDAGRFLEKALEQRPGDPMVFYFQGLLAHRQGKLKDALILYDKALIIYNNLGGAWFQKGNIYLFQNRLKEARYNFRKSAELSSGYEGKAAFALAKTAALQKDKGAMMDHLKAAEKAGYFGNLSRRKQLTTDEAFQPYLKDKAFQQFRAKLATTTP